MRVVASPVVCCSVLLSGALSVLSCAEEKEHPAPAIHDRDSVSVMVSYGVNTLVSDSGVIKYRIVTERWDVNQIRVPSRWTFIKGLFMEQFDERFHVQAYIQADTAWYYDKLKLDLFYIENYTVWLDLKLMLLTLKILFSPDSTEGVDARQVTAMKHEVEEGEK